MVLLFRIQSVQLGVEPLTAHAVCYFQHTSAITSALLLNYRAYPFNRSVNSLKFAIKFG